jgi:hypothetical protein
MSGLQKAQDLRPWLGAEVVKPGSDSRSYREDEQQRHGRKDKLYGPVICEADP